MTVKANAITVNKKEYKDMCQALIDATKELIRLKERNREMVEAIVNLLRDIKKQHPADFEGEGTGYRCPYVRELLHIAVKEGWNGE